METLVVKIYHMELTYGPTQQRTDKDLQIVADGSIERHSQRLAGILVYLFGTDNMLFIYDFTSGRLGFWHLEILL